MSSRKCVPWRVKSMNNVTQMNYLDAKYFDEINYFASEGQKGTCRHLTGFVGKNVMKFLLV